MGGGKSEEWGEEVARDPGEGFGGRKHDNKNRTPRHTEGVACVCSSACSCGETNKSEPYLLRHGGVSTSERKRSVRLSTKEN